MVLNQLNYRFGLIIKEMKVKDVRARVKDNETYTFIGIELLGMTGYSLESKSFDGHCGQFTIISSF